MRPLSILCLIHPAISVLWTCVPAYAVPTVVEIDASEERDVTTSTKVFLAGRRCDDVIVIPDGELEI
jgi:hypothetical protein